jgi:hypothetical protein
MALLMVILHLVPIVGTQDQQHIRCWLTLPC